MAGVPAEYFNSNQRAPLSERWQSGAGLHAYASELRARRTSQDGVFGLKLHWDQMEHICTEVGHVSARPTELLDDLFPGVAYIHIKRSDVDRQAVSLWTALHTGVWSVKAGATVNHTSDVPYSHEGIGQCKAFILRGETEWAGAFAHAGIQPVRVVYEELVAAYQATIASVLEQLLGQSPGWGEIPEPDSRRQLNDRSEELYALFQRDSARRGRDRTMSSRNLPSVLRA